MNTLQGAGIRSPARFAAVLGVLAGLAGLAAGCSLTSIRPRDTLSAASVEGKIAAQLARSYGVGAPKVKCPVSVPAQVGTKFTCTTKLDGQVLRVAGTVTGPRGRVAVHPTSAIIVTSAAEIQIGKSLSSTFKLQVTTVSCAAPPVLVTSPGHSFRCTAEVGSNRRQVVVTVTDLAGTVSLRVLPYSAPS